MTKSIRVVCVGPAPSVQGGISRVIELISSHLPSRIAFHQVATFTRYTGYKGTAPHERGSRIEQAFVFALAFLRVLILAVGRRTVFHVHFADREAYCAKASSAWCFVRFVASTQCILMWQIRHYFMSGYR